MLDYENAANPYDERRTTIALWHNLAVIDVDTSAELVAYARNVMGKGIKIKDALHLACAVRAQCSHFLTTDKKLLKTLLPEIAIVNPIDFVTLIEQQK